MDHMVVLGVVGRGHAHAYQLITVIIGTRKGDLGEGIILHDSECSRNIGRRDWVAKFFSHLQRGDGWQGCHRLEGGEGGIVMPLGGA